MASQLSPRKGEQAKDELDRTIRSLSTDFQLQLHIPDLTLSPSKRRQQHRNGDQERSEHIYLCAYRLKFQDPNRLAICLTRFREQADEHLKNWIRKPRADPDTTPSKSFGPHRQRTRLTSEERAELQDFLLQLLKDDNIANRQRSKYSKRKSDEFSDPSSKRSRNSFEGSPACDSIDSIPVRSRAVVSSSGLSTGRPARGAGTSSFTNGIGHSATTSFASTQPSSFGARSFNSSKVSLAPTVFTNDYAPSTPATTVTNTSFKRSQLPFQATQPSFTSNVASSRDIQIPFSQSIQQFAYKPPSEENRNDIDPPKPLSFRRYGDRTPPEPVIDLTDDDEPEEEPRLPVLSMPQQIRSQVDLKRAGMIRSSSPATAYSSLPEMNEFDTMLLDATMFDPEPAECPLTDRLRNTWPKFPIPGLNQAPLVILWELTRAALHCRVDLSTWDLEYQPNDSWHDQTKFRGQLLRHRLFVGQGLPPACDRAAWDAAFGSFASHDKAVVLAAEFVCNTEDTGQLYRLKLQPPRLELGHRLARRFGADRFLEVIMPSPTSRDAPDVIKQDPQGANKIIKWLTESFHYFLGRSWAAFYTREAKKSIKDPRPPHKSLTIMQERVYFFATDGINFRIPMSQFPPLEEATSLGYRTKMRRCDLLNWAINIEQNSSQPVPKLFSRLALSLSKTVPTIVIEPHQFRHRDTMLGFHKYMTKKEKKEQKDMGDGIGRMSRNLARRIATHMGLLETPSAFQARIGSAKGMWIVDVEDDGLDNDDWIETYPSQRKWNCDFKDVHHRTFEVREWSRELKSAALNTQFIPVLEAQAPVPQDMRNVIARHLANGLQEEIGGQLAAMTHPTNLRGFTHRGFDRATLGNVPFLGALPEREEDIISYMLDAGFDATKCRFLRDMVWNNQKRQAEQLKAKMNIKIPRSTYAFMTVDFTGTLEEGEVQLAFSSKFQADGESDTLLDGIDILVARAPAHFVSDIQKVKAVFRPNLKRLKDVIVFSSKGKSPLADMLSGGDYDGDLAWICWDPDVVNNFNNAPKPVEPDLVGQGYLRKCNPSFESILEAATDVDSACADFLCTAITFNMQPRYLGIATKFKEKLCYLERGVNSERAVALSTLVALLVDQAKQGLLFTREDYDRLKRDMQMQGKDPEYENERSSRRNYVNRDGSIHILDELKFIVAEDTIADALKKFSDALFGKDVPVQAWDKDLARLWDDFESQKNESRIIGRLMTDLRAQVSDISDEWKKTMAGGKSDSSNSDFGVKVRELHQKWSSYQPPPELLTSRQVKPLLDKWNGDPSLSKWELLKASTMFKLGYQKSYSMLWHLSGKQLAWMKATMSRSTSDASAIAVTAEMWSILRPDNKRIVALNARRQIGHDNESFAALEEVMEYDETGTQIDDA
ncbi:RNA-dependent RNA polymerase 2 [Fusarium coicis]|nr:RNA-dependent RNA polymerase 2 [Fusarium coicis]